MTACFAWRMTDIPMFPLGSVLFPHMPLQLRIFEDRYLAMLASMIETERTEFGVVLIERGQEVGGGEHRYSYGTVASVTQMAAGDGFVGLVALGAERIEVVEWLDDRPFPRAEVRELDDLEWSDDLDTLRHTADTAVRRILAIASEFSDQYWPPDVALSDDPAEAAWQLAAIAPVGEVDQLRLLRSTSMEGLLTAIIEVTEEAAVAFSVPWSDAAPDGLPDDDDEVPDN